MYKHERGHAVWKFVFDCGVYYRNRNPDAFRYFFDNVERRFDVYARSLQGGWIHVAQNDPTACSCGRLYDDNNVDEFFMWRDTAYIRPLNMENLKKVFQMPGLCAYCYYREEYRHGRWIPRYIRDTFEN